MKVSEMVAGIESKNTRLVAENNTLRKQTVDFALFIGTHGLTEKFEQWMVSGIRDCPNGLLPDGPTCPKCGGRRGPSGVDGGSWVHY